MSAVAFRDVSFAYPEAAPALPRAALRGVDLDVAPGELLLVLGASGSGKSTLLRAVNGLVPHTSGGRFGGDVVVFGRSTRTHRPRELADVVGAGDMEIAGDETIAMYCVRPSAVLPISTSFMRFDCRASFCQYVEICL